MPLAILGIIAGLVLLTLAADQFVAGAARVSVALRLSPIVVGAVVIGFGTSAPEMLVSGLAAWQGQLDIAVGNIVGSNIANLSLVLGAATLVATISVRSTVLRREAPLSLGAVLLFAVLLRGGLTRFEGVVLLVSLVAALTWILRNARGGDPALESEVEEFLDDGATPSLRRESLRTFLGLLGTVGAAQLLVTSATDIADRLGLATGFVGLTLVAIGTSLPELATSIQAARKDEGDLILGNLLGSNLFNSLAVGGIAAVVGPGMVQSAALVDVASVLMVGVVGLATVFMFVRGPLSRFEGAILLVIYVASMPLLAAVIN